MKQVNSVLEDVLDQVRKVCPRQIVEPDASLEHDLKVRGDDGEDLIEALAAAYGVWVLEWPWQRFLNINEPPKSGAELFRFILPRSWWKTAFPGVFDLQRLTPRHIASVVEAGEWREP